MKSAKKSRFFLAIYSPHPSRRGHNFVPRAFPFVRVPRFYKSDESLYCPIPGFNLTHFDPPNPKLFFLFFTELKRFWGEITTPGFYFTR